jgi:WD40 repeat protein
MNLPSRFRWCLAIAPFLLAVTLIDAGGPAKLPVPDQASQAKARKLVLEVFQEDLKRADGPMELAKLAGELLQQGRDTRDDQTLRYVLLAESRDLAARAGDAGLAFIAINEIAKSFAVDVLAGKAATLKLAVQHADTKEAGKALLDQTLPLITDALDADAYGTARAFGEVAEAAARKAKSPSLVLDAQKRLNEIAAAEKGFAKQQGYLDRLKNNPMDAQANLELGRYYGLVKPHFNWDKAMPYLAKGSDKALKILAERDLAQPKDAVPQLALADAWWDLAGKESDPARLAIQARAAHWYEKAIGQLSGLNRTKAQKRLDLVAERQSGTPAVTVGAFPVAELKKMEGHTDEIKGVAFSNDGLRIVSGGLDNSVRVWDAASGKQDKLLQGHTKQVWSVAFHPNNRQVFSASWDTTVRLWDVKTGNEAKRYTHPLDVNGIAIARDGNTFLSACDDKHAYLWNTSSGDQMRSYSGNTNFVYAVAFAPDGKHLATGGVDRTPRIYELATGTLVRACDSQSNSIYQIAFTNDSKQLLTSGDSAIHVWDVATGKEVRRLEGHTGLVQAMAISPDGRRLVTGGDDRIIRLWDVASGKELYQFKGHTDTVTCLAFAHDGRRIVSGSGSMDRTVRVWGLPAR